MWIPLIQINRQTTCAQVESDPEMRAPVRQPGDLVITIREACGAGMHLVNGVCVTTHARRSARRCAAGVTCN